MSRAAGQYVKNYIQQLEAKTGAVLHSFKKYYVDEDTWWTIGFKGTRLQGPALLTECYRILNEDRFIESADYGCALCVLLYNSKNLREDFESMIDDYLDIHTDNPHIIRWQISISYIAAQKLQSEQYLIYCCNWCANEFSPLILTKKLPAARQLAVHYMKHHKDKKAAEKTLRTALNEFIACMKMDTKESIGDYNEFSMNGIIEMQDVFKEAAETLFMLQNLDHYGSAEYSRKVLAGKWQLNVPIGVEK